MDGLRLAGQGGRARRRGRRDAAAQPAAGAPARRAGTRRSQRDTCAGAADAQVGGDWYDVIALRDGHAAIAIGDVVGPRARRGRPDGAAAERPSRLRARGAASLARARADERLRARGLRRADGDPDVRRGRSRRGPPATCDRRAPAAAGDPARRRRLLRRGPGRKPARRRAVPDLRGDDDPARPRRHGPPLHGRARRATRGNRSTRGSNGCASFATR